MFVNYGPDGGEKRLIALRHGTTLLIGEGEAAIADQAERVERCIVERDCPACFYRVDVKRFDEH